MTVAGDMVRFAQQRIAAILRTPDTWGSPEAVELQVLLLLQVYHLATAAPRAVVDGVMGRYRQFLGTALPGHPPVLLAARLELSGRADAAFVAHLTDFVSRERQMTASVVPGAATSFPRADRLGPAHYVWS